MRGWPLIKLLPQKTNFQFVKYARAAGVLSVVLCLASIIGCFYPGLNMGIDFRGGASMEVSKPAGQTIELDRVREAVNGLNLGDVQVQGIARRDTNVDDGSTAPEAAAPRPSSDASTCWSCAWGSRTFRTRTLPTSAWI